MSLFARKTDDEPLCGFDKKPCIKHRCQHYCHVTGNHPQTGASIDRWDCNFNLQLMLLMQNGRAITTLDGEVSALRKEQAGAAKAFTAFIEKMTEAMERADRARALASGEPQEQLSLTEQNETPH